MFFSRRPSAVFSASGKSSAAMAQGIGEHSRGGAVALSTPLSDADLHPTATASPRRIGIATTRVRTTNVRFMTGHGNISALCGIPFDAWRCCCVAFGRRNEAGAALVAAAGGAFNGASIFVHMSQEVRILTPRLDGHTCLGSPTFIFGAGNRPVRMSAFWRPCPLNHGCCESATTAKNRGILMNY